MKEFIIQSRITPPRAPVNIVSRSSLMDLLKTNSDKKLILVTAPAGYGKTTTINEFINSSQERFSWYHINKDINSAYVFLKYIIHALRKLEPGFGEETLSTISSLEKDSRRIKDINAAIDEIIYTLTDEFLKTFKGNVILVIDDFQDAGENDTIDYSLDKLISELPANLRLILISRHIPKLNISHLRAKREVLEITTRELAFASSQIKHLASKLYSKNYSDETIQYLESSLGGWITGIHLLIQTTAEESDIKSFTGKLMPDNLFDYFAEEIFAKQSEDVKIFLLTTAHLESFDADICAFLLDSPDTEEILNYLSGKNIFIESVQLINDKGHLVNNYNYIQLFKTFLARKSNETSDKNRLKDIYAKTSSYYSSANDPEQAINFAILSENYTQSSKLVIENYDSLFHNGKFEKLWNWISTIEQNTGEVNPWLLYYKGVLSKFYIGKLDDSLANFEKALEVPAGEMDNDLLVTITISRAEILLNRGKFQQAIESLSSIKEDNISQLSLARLFHNLGNAYFYVGRYDAAIEYLEKASSICRENNFEDLLADVCNTFGNIYINNGEFILSIHYYELTLTKTSSLNKKFTVLGNLSILYSRSAKYDKAKEFYDKALDLLKIFKTPIFELAIKMVQYTLVFELGDYDSSLALAGEINASSIKMNSPFHTHLSYLLLGESAYYLGNIQKSKSYYNLSMDFIDSENEKDRTILNMLQAINSLSLKNDPKLEVDLLRAYSFLDTESANYDKISAGLYLAEFYFKSGMNETSLKYLDKTLTLAKEKEYFSLLIREYLRSPELFKFSVQNKLHKDITKEIFGHIQDIRSIGWITPAYRLKLGEKISTLYDIKMSCFGDLEFTVMGKTVDESKWIRKKRKLILCYLFMANNYSLTKDKIIDIFFTDTPLESIDNTFHQAVSNLRTALKSEPAEKKKDKKDKTEVKQGPEYILYEGKQLRLNPDYNYYSDAEEFNKLTLKAADDIIEINSRIALLESALQLYKGDFLSGHYEPWVENLRDEFRNRFVKYSELLLELLDKEDNFEMLDVYSQKLINIDKLNENANYFMIKSKVKTGRAQLAAEFYSKMIKTYEDDIGEKPNTNFLNKVNLLLNI